MPNEGYKDRKHHLNHHFFVNFMHDENDDHDHEDEVGDDDFGRCAENCLYL